MESKIVYPYGLTLDLPLKRVYWVDTYLDYIEAVDYDGGNRKTILRGELHTIVKFIEGTLTVFKLSLHQQNL